MAAWPSTLPQDVMAAGYEELAPSNSLRSSTGYGPDKIRPLSTSAVRKIKFSMLLTSAMVATLDTFYSSTVVFGALEFTWKHPRTDVACTMRFVDPPSYKGAGGDFYAVSISIEILP